MTSLYAITADLDSGFGRGAPPLLQPPYSAWMYL